MHITTSLLRPHFACLRTMEASEVTMEGEYRVLRCLECYLTCVRLSESLLEIMTQVTIEY